MKSESRKFQAEQLEERVLLAGDVTVIYFAVGAGPFAAGDLIIQNDLDVNDGPSAGDQDVTVEILPTGQISLTSAAGDNFDVLVFAGGPPIQIADDVASFVSPVALPGINDLYANSVPLVPDFETGADNLTLVNIATAGDLSIEGTAEANVVALDSVDVGGDLTIDTFAGNDGVILSDSSVADDAMVDLGDGNDLLSATYNVFGDPVGPFEDLTFDMGAGDDLLEYGGNVFYNTGRRARRRWRWIRSSGLDPRYAGRSVRQHRAVAAQLGALRSGRRQPDRCLML